ncbi:spore maturation protein CgeB [Scopulibacillus darangshiensis]|uniref:Spore maturation protein CgeB n=1 Tax=Scopulibacillus darangshiensis TaxID=442528 RepID=A0A4V2SLK4_9BACL|nr:glycosyltransferase [Scopulibacillus darangshiensis]TCP23786.1 spore maturation protein CgeB [Scopulibacillus darangshiensis]
MEKLKLLFITKDQSNKPEKSSYYLTEELKKHCQLMVWHQDGDISNILSQLSFQPDFILLNDWFAPKLCPNINGLKNNRIPKGMIFHDMSNHVHERKRFIVNENIDAVFPHYRDAFKKWYPKFIHRMIWLPHHANIDVYKDYQIKKDIDLLMMGAIAPQLYPLRSLMLKSFYNKPGFIYHPHPGYTNEKDRKPGSFVGKDYAKEINRTKLFLTCNSIFGYSLLKYFEVLACNTLLLAPLNKELSDLGFVDGETMVQITRHDFHEKAIYYIKNEEERLRIANKGYYMVRRNHSTENRAKMLVKNIERIINRFE